MSTLTELYALVRTQTQTTQGELPDATILPWLQQGCDRAIAAYTDWPFLEEQWTITQQVGESSIAHPANAHLPGVVSLVDQEGTRLRMINQETAEDAYQYSFGGTKPFEYSIWGKTISLWPRILFDELRTFTLRGFRLLPRFATFDPSTDLAADPMGLDARLHPTLANYAIALAYAQQEDEYLETTYMTRWQRDVELIARAIMEPARNRQVQMGPHYRSAQPGYPFRIIPPGGS